MHDVAIVGAGPVGKLLGCLLARLGLDVRVLERRTEAITHSRAIGIHPPALEVFSELGIVRELIDRGVRVHRGVVRTDGEDVGSLTFERAAPLYPFVLTVPQYVTEHVLERLLEHLAPGALTRGFQVSGIAAGDDYVEITGPSVVRARYVVAADGNKSTVRAAAGIRVRAVDFPDTYLMGDFADSTIDGARAVIHLERSGVVESFPLPESRRRWVAWTRELVANADAEELADIIRIRTGEGVDTTTNSMLSAFQTRSRLTTHMVLGRTILIGDAAHEISPIGGQGMNLGWLDAAELAPALAASIRSRIISEKAASANPGSNSRVTVGACGKGNRARHSALARFERRRLRAAWIADRQARANMALGRPLTGAGLSAVRGGALRLALATPLRTAMARAFTMRRL